MVVILMEYNNSNSVEFTAYMFQFYDINPNTPDILFANGNVWYEFYNGSEYYYAGQLFGKNKIIGVGKFERNVWEWNGNRENPTLTPSFLIEENQVHKRFHCFVRDGKIDVLPDSEVIHGKEKRLSYEEFFKTIEEDSEDV